VAVLGNNSGFYLQILSAIFWQWQNNACNIYLTAWLILHQSVAVMDITVTGCCLLIITFLLSKSVHSFGL